MVETAYKKSILVGDFSECYFVTVLKNYMET